MVNDVPIQLMWGIFCRRAIVDKDTGELSLIDILPGIGINVPLNTTKEISSSQALFPLGNMSNVLMFSRKIPLSEEINLQSEVEITFVGIEKISIQQELRIDPYNFFGFNTLSLINPNVNILLASDQSVYTCQVQYKFDGYEIANLELPIYVNATKDEHA